MIHLCGAAVHRLIVKPAIMTAMKGEAPTFEIEDGLRSGGARCVAGVDEVGRGAWAGPVVVCAAIAGSGAPPDGLTDSKRLTERRRTAIAEALRGWLRAYAFGSAGPGEIDDAGMTEALRRATVRALRDLPARPDAIILDGRHNYLGTRAAPGSDHPWPVRTEIKADLRSVSVAAASVLAKVHRDALMAGLGEEYGFAGNAGYPSPVHREALRRLGPGPHHRLSWSYLDDLPEWRHLRRHRPEVEGQLSLI